MIEVIPIETPELGNRSYLATDGEVALVLDPQRDIDRVLAVAEHRGLRITHVVETHVHNDYVSGGLALARQAGAEYVCSADDQVAFERRPVRDGDVIEVGSMRVQAFHTPGHTFTHMAFALAVDEEVVGAFTGGSLLFGSTGRPDLLGAENTRTLARKQHASIRRLAAAMPPQAAIFPTHGFGSFCAATQASGTESTFVRERLTNPALIQDEDTFVQQLLEGLQAYPSYYAHMAALNAAGPGPVDLTAPRRADPSEIRRRIDAGEWVVDLRTRKAFIADHVAGTLNFGIDGNFVTYIGWLIPWGTPVTLLAESEADVAQAQRQLARIGIDRPAASAAGAPCDWSTGDDTRSIRNATFVDLAGIWSVNEKPFVLDVRADDEHGEAHLVGSHHIPLHLLDQRIEEIPLDEPVWIHCASGYRAAIAAGIISRSARKPVVIDDDFANADVAGLQVLARRAG